MDTKFTPGPWEVSTNKGKDKVYIVGPLDHPMVINLGLKALMNEADTADANLIASSPEMFFLLEMAKCPDCDGSGAYQMNDGEVCQCQWCYERDLTIKKAKGINQ